MLISINRWEDGQAVKRQLLAPDRWEVHAAESCTVNFTSKLSVHLKQQPGALAGNRIGVGACLWDGALVLASHLAMRLNARTPYCSSLLGLVQEGKGAVRGKSCVELGAGVGLEGILLAKLGAKVVLTDRAPVLALLHDNVRLNNVEESEAGLQTKAEHSGVASVQELEWGKEGYMQTVAALAPVDLVVAADCCYIDHDGPTPSIPHFMAACAGLCGPSSRCLISFEDRSCELQQAFFKAAHEHFKQVDRLSLSHLPPALQLGYVELIELREKCSTW